jgi:hypothetical protein
VTLIAEILFGVAVMGLIFAVMGNWEDWDD